mgnify:CR=1 FL=1
MRSRVYDKQETNEFISQIDISSLTAVHKEVAQLQRIASSTIIKTMRYNPSLPIPIPKVTGSNPVGCANLFITHTKSIGNG